MQYWETKFRNERTSSVEVLESGGKVLLELQPGQTKFVESRDPSTSYAPWDEVTFKDDGSVKLHENRAWRWPGPPDKLMLTILNRDGANSELFYVGAAEPVHCFKGIPRYVAIDIHDTPWSSVERLEIKLVEHKAKEGDFLVKKNVLEHVRTLRSKKEIRAIEQQLLDEATAKAKADLAKRFPMRERS